MREQILDATIFLAHIQKHDNLDPDLCVSGYHHSLGSRCGMITLFPACIFEDCSCHLDSHNSLTMHASGGALELQRRGTLRSEYQQLLHRQCSAEYRDRLGLVDSAPSIRLVDSSQHGSKDCPMRDICYRRIVSCPIYSDYLMHETNMSSICIISIVRLVIMLNAYKTPSVDVTWVFIGPSTWTAVETNIGIVSGKLLLNVNSVG